MRRPAWMLVGRVVAVAAAIGAGVLAYRAGGGAEPPANPPRPDPVASRAAAGNDGGAGKPGGDTYEVALRLVEVAKDARVETVKESAAQTILNSHWRKLRPPFMPSAPSVWSVALRTSATETQWAMAQGSGKMWTPDARTWNMNEGTYDQRESLVSPGVTTITFKVNVPASAKLTFAEGTVNATKESTVFGVTLVDQKGAKHELHQHKLPPSDARQWKDQTVDLGEFAGQDVELRFATSTAPASVEEKKVAPRKKGAPSPVSSALAASTVVGMTNAPPGKVADGGVQPDVLAVPGVSVALWGNPVILAKTTPKVPYNVVWVVIDALRPDVIPSFHDDAEDQAKQAAKLPPLDALLPKVPGLTPAIDDLARRGVRFTHAYSAAAWTRPGTLAMLAGARSSELGIDTTNWVLGPRDVQRFYAADPPLLSLILRKRGVVTRAFVNNYFMVGYAPIGVDMGFERVMDERYRTRDTLEITQDATAWIKENKDQRFFLFVNYNSPHEPYEPPKKMIERVPGPPVGPKDPIAKLYMAEAAKDDEAIGVLMQTLAENGLTDRTIVVVTADHGETLSAAHSGTSGLEKMPIRYHHAVSNFEETIRVPIVIAAPGLLPEGKEVKPRVRTIDIVPTIVELLGLEQHPRTSGKSMVTLAKGGTEPDERVVVSEGRSSRGIMFGHHRLVVREGDARTTIIGDKSYNVAEELFDLNEDPGERRDISKKEPQIVAEMKARLDAALKNVPVVGTHAASVTPAAQAAASLPLRLRFVGAGQTRRVAGTFTIGDAKNKATFEVQPVELGKEAWKVDGNKIEVSFTTTPSGPVGFDLNVHPGGAPVTWDLYLDDRPWPDEAIYGGPYGLLAPVLRKGVASDEARAAAHATAFPPLDGKRDFGLFVVRERRAEGGEATTSDEGAEEMARLLKEWGYAHGSK